MSRHESLLVEEHGDPSDAPSDGAIPDVGVRAGTPDHSHSTPASRDRAGKRVTFFSTDLASAFARAYIGGFQGTSSRTDALTSTSVACMAKHFPGGGAQKDGEDPHFPYGKEQTYPGGAFEYHLVPLIEAIDAGVAAIMPYYSLPAGLVRNGRSVEEGGFGFNKYVVTGILRRLGRHSAGRG